MSAKRQLTREDVEKVLDCVFTPLEASEGYKAYPPGSFDRALNEFSLPTNAKPENHSPATGESPALSPDRQNLT